MNEILEVRDRAVGDWRHDGETARGGDLTKAMRARTASKKLDSVGSWVREEKELTGPKDRGWSLQLRAEKRDRSFSAGTTPRHT